MTSEDRITLPENGHTNGQNIKRQGQFTLWLRIG